MYNKYNKFCVLISISLAESTLSNKGNILIQTLVGGELPTFLLAWLFSVVTSSHSVLTVSKYFTLSEYL